MSSLRKVLDSLDCAMALVLDEHQCLAGFTHGFGAFMADIGVEVQVGMTATQLHIRLQEVTQTHFVPFGVTVPIEEQLAWQRTWLRIETPLAVDGGRLVQWFETTERTARRRVDNLHAWQSMLDRAMVAVGIVNDDGTWVMVNRCLAMLPGQPHTGISIEALGGIAPDLVKAFHDFRGGDTVYLRQIRWGVHHWSAQIHTGALEGEFVTWIWLVDITAEVQSKTKAFGLLAEQTELLDAATDAVVDLDVVTGLCRINRRAAQLANLVSNAGWTDVSVHALFDRLGSQAGTELLTLAQEVVARPVDRHVPDRTWRGRFSLAAGDLHVDVQLRPMPRHAGDNRVRCLMVIRDIDDIVRTTASLQALLASAQQARLAKELFLATMSHELRTPFAGVVAALEAVMTTLEEGGRGRDLVAQALRAAKHLTELLDGILDLQRLEEGRLRLALEPIDIKEVVGEVASLLRPKAHVEIKLFIDPAVPPFVGGDTVRVRQILFNLVGNASKFTAEGFIEIVVENRPHGLRFAVTDTGPGMPQQVIDRIFAGERFVQADMSAARRHGGSGLGLSIVEQLVALMGGSWKISSNDQGTRVEVDLPLRPTANVLELSPVQGGIGGLNQNLSLLLVEDDDLLRRATSMLLRRVGITHRVAASGEEALSQLGGHARFDAVLTDLHMANISGWDVARAIQSLPSPRPRVIALTADALASQRVAELRAAGIEKVLLKPVLADQLMAVLRSEPGLAPDIPPDPEADLHVVTSAPIVEPHVILHACPVTVEAVAMLRDVAAHLRSLLARAQVSSTLAAAAPGEAFRYFHTLKGTARVSGAPRVEIAATAAEAACKADQLENYHFDRLDAAITEFEELVADNAAITALVAAATTVQSPAPV